MVRSISVLAMLVATLARPAAAEDDRGLAGSTPAFLESLQVNVVNVEAYVTDKEGRPVTGLTARDFVVEEDGRKMRLTNFSAVEVERPAAGESEDRQFASDLPPQYVVLYLDDYTIDAAQRRRALDELRGFVHADRAADVAYAVAVFDGTLKMPQPFTYDRDLVLAALRESGELSPLGIIRQREREAVVREGLSMLSSIRELTASEIKDTEVPRLLADVSRQIDGYAARVSELNRASYYALSHLANSLAALPGRKAVIYVSDGLPARPGQELYEAVAETIRSVRQDEVDQQDFEAVDADIRARSSALSAIESGRGSRRTKVSTAPSEDLKVLTALANASGVSFYSYKAQGNVGGVQPEFGGAGVELFSPRFKSLQEDNLAETLRVLADETGGAAVIGGELDTLLEGVRADSSGFYSLGYEPRHSGDGEFHEVKVKVRGRGLDVRYRRGYVDKPLAVKVADRTSTALLLGVDDNPLGIELAVGAGRPAERDGLWIVPVRVGIPLAAVTLRREGAVHALDAQLYIAARSPGGDLAPVQEATLRIEVPAADLETALSRVHVTEFELSMRGGEQRLAIGFVDPLAVVSSFVSRDIEVDSH